MKISKELQLGKAGEHLVCADLILQGYNAFLSDQGLLFDVVVEKNRKLKRIQVKTTQKLISPYKNYKKSNNIYRFGTRRCKGNRTRIDLDSIDYFAFVALDIKKIAYLSINEMITKKKTIKQTIDFKTRRIKYLGRVYSNGTIRSPEWGKYFEDYSKLGK